MLHINRTNLAITLFVLSVVFIFFTYYIFGGDNTIKNYPAYGRDIVAFGDSLVEGVGASSPDRNFVSLLSSKIGKPIINLGVTGNTTQDGLDRIKDLDQYNPKIVVLLLGGNDHLKKVPIETTFANLEKIIEKIQAKGAIVLLLGVRGNLISDKFKPYFEKLKSKYQTAYVSDVLDGLFGGPQYMSDLVHPNDFGYQKIADRIYPVLTDLLK